MVLKKVFFLKFLALETFCVVCWRWAVAGRTLCFVVYVRCGVTACKCR